MKGKSKVGHDCQVVIPFSAPSKFSEFDSGFLEGHTSDAKSLLATPLKEHNEKPGYRCFHEQEQAFCTGSFDIGADSVSLMGCALATAWYFGDDSGFHWNL